MGIKWPFSNPSSSNNIRPIPPDITTESDTFDNALAFARRPPASIHPAPLQRPIAIPRLQSRVGAPFARLYPPELLQYDVPINEFLDFLDNLNIVCADFVPLQILDAVGSIVGLVPYHWAQLAGAVTSLGSKSSVYALSKFRGEAFLRRANSEYFLPRMLSVQLCTTDALVRLGHIPHHAAMMPPLDHVSATMSIEERQLAHLMPWLSPVTDQVPPPSPQSNWLKQFCNKQAAHASKVAQRKAMNDRFHAFEKQGLAPEQAHQMFATLRAKGDFSPAQIDKLERKYTRGQQEQSKMQKEYENECHKIQKNAEKDILKAHRKGDSKDLYKAEKKRDVELAKLNTEYSKKLLKRKKSFEKEDKERRKGNKSVWLLIQSTSPASTHT